MKATHIAYLNILFRDKSWKNSKVNFFFLKINWHQFSNFRIFHIQGQNLTPPLCF